VASGDEIPSGLRLYFQEYDPGALDLHRDAVLIIQRTIEHGTWEEVRWLFTTYGRAGRTAVRYPVQEART